MASSPIAINTDLITFSVSSDGSPIDDTYQVISVKIEMAVNQISYCELVIMDGSPASAEFPVSDSATFVPGTEIEVQAGYENNNQKIFSGVVIKHGIRIGSDTGPALTVVCQDKAMKMTVGRKNAYFKDTTDSDIISKLIKNYSGLSAEVSTTNNQLKEVIQYYVSDWDFMLSRAEANGMIVLVQNGKVSVKSPDEVNEEVLSLTYGDDILDFNAEIDAGTQFKSIRSSAWDVKNQAAASGSADLSDFPIGNLSGPTLAEVVGLDHFQLQSSGFLENDSLNTWAKAQATKSKYAKVKGEVKFQGSALALPGKLIELKGLGKRFNGRGFVSGVRHELSMGNWFTTVRIGLSPEWYAAKVKTEAPLASGLLPGMQGLQIGKVLKIDNDPDGEFRVLVRLPMIQTDKEGVWARLATFYATENAGAFFYPEIDDEVVVGFFNDDPRYPVILGAMHSSARPAPEMPDETNRIKAFVSKGQMKVTFDEEQKIITMLTPAGNQMIFSDEEKSITIKDQHENSIELSSSGIQIKSASGISLQAARSISIEGPEGVSASASGGSISLSGMSISCTADTEFSATSTSSTSISSSGEVSVSGTLVLINS